MSDGKQLNSYAEIIEEYIKKDRSPLPIGEIRCLDESVIARHTSSEIKTVYV